MKRYEPETAGSLLRAILEKGNMQAGMDAARAAEAWGMVVGPVIAAKTSRPDLAGGILTVRVAHAPLRHELSMRRTGIAAAINGIIGRSVVDEIRFRS